MNIFSTQVFHSTSTVDIMVKTTSVMPAVIACILLGICCVRSAYGQCGDHCLDCKHGTCSECIYGWYGTDCTKSCQGCWYDRCERDTGRCVQCSPGYYSNACNKGCPLDCRESYDGDRYCDRDTGGCLEGCVPRRWGHQCERVCSSTCEESVCDQDEGTCLLGCTDGWFGQLCDTPCPENCLGNRCNLFQGYCGRCKPGFIGRKCDIQCRNCADNTCTYNELLSSVSCTRGCVKGWTDEDCQSPCSNRCLDEDCNINGTCKRCPDGYYGDICTVACEQSCLKCEQISGVCTLKQSREIRPKEDSYDLPTTPIVLLSHGSRITCPRIWMCMLATICYGLSYGWG
ncbi:platelet endothelial aggregation receptor 1-like [Haliotis rufescens]|uniref:platelet endothelial aggregation receptor 1-like n=1 Tax=Haliotis rufescens TaxID=6454 RepID=UPI00201FAB15|nr:platelet endothelial aggregation receptor 1-like [Haliotis rufescens]XP_046327746.2 platelet endothelial aggregation receptor 1-like [Haliotis rufescens]XP_046327747.2 platelet endothelial aggregation receptor 1-like [Haliotis rufescens]XP_046327748.2 platelet endothelial aggregation receptor 1-like [Haliotis rufescens]